MAKAMPKYLPGNVSASMLCSLGARPPPPAPWNTRNSSRLPREGAIPHRKELTVNRATQIM